ncbi:hypothetical protein ACUN24_14975 [Pedobacter sp. WC2501]|uniref:hypothetical protein n=1 Tax=Pedobacter sp. WC2501 TaxID=3461400 RepID=UPI004045DAA7
MLTNNRKIINYSLPFVFFGVLILLIKTDYFKNSQLLSLAVTIDLLISIPIIYYLIIRKSEINKTTVLPILLIGILIGSFFLPKEDQAYLNLFKIWILPVVELITLVFIVKKFREAIKKNNALRDCKSDFFTVLNSSCSKVLPKKLAFLFATEIAVFYYGFINWKNVITKENEFSYHKKSGTPAIFGALILAATIETIAFHFLLALWSIKAAWIFTAISTYAVVQLFGIAKSLSKRPIIIDEEYLVLRYGILNEVIILHTDIKDVELSKKSLEKNIINRKLSPLGEVESHNIIISLKKEYILKGIYGINKKAKVIALHLDEPDNFINKIRCAVQSFS